MKTQMILGALLSAVLIGCSSQSSSITPEEQLAVHFGVRGEMHMHLDAIEGEFETRCSYWPRHNANLRESEGLMTSSWDEDGMYIVSAYEGDLMGTPMTISFAMTWDDVRGCYVGIWSDSDGSTVLPLGDGHMDPDGAIVTVRCEDGVSVREVLSIQSEDRHVREIYRMDPTGEEYLSMRLEMTRIQNMDLPGAQ